MTTAPPDSLAVFSLGTQLFALHVGSVERVVRAVALGAFSPARRGVIGGVNVHGTLLPVFDLRSWLGGGMPGDFGVNDYLVLVRTARQRLALLASNLGGVRSGEIGPAPPGQGSREEWPGVTHLADGSVFIHDPDRFLNAAGGEPGAEAGGALPGGPGHAREDS